LLLHKQAVPLRRIEPAISIAGAYFGQQGALRCLYYQFFAGKASATYNCFQLAFTDDNNLRIAGGLYAFIGYDAIVKAF
jgi:hypothetical protein